MNSTPRASSTNGREPLLPDTVDLAREYVDMPMDEASHEVIETQREFSRYWKKEKDLTLLSYISEPLVIVLGEARSGKTTEFKLATKKIQAKGENAFFLRLEDLVNSSVQSLDAVRISIENHDLEQFNAWLDSESEAVFFMDAVDETKLRHPSDFRRAIKLFHRGLAQNLKRVRLFVSCRVTEWNGKEDAEVLKSIKNDLTSVDKDEAKHSVQKDLCLVQILPLELEQVKKLAKHFGLIDPKPFIDAIENTDALEFVARPGDVKGHVRIWQEKGHFGTFTELVEVDIQEKLQEDNELYKGDDPLSHEKARLGAEKLAAGSIFCKEANYRFVSSEMDETRAPQALDPNILLLDWTETERKALLRRPLFDEATYGRVRLHTRTVREYLAAQWLLKRHKDGCPPEEIVDHLFVNKYGKTIILPSRGNVAAWIAPEIKEVFEIALEHNPELLPDAGDPEKFTIEQKKSIIEAYAERYKDRQRTGFKYDRLGLTRFSHQDLGATINKYLKTNNLPKHFKEFLFDIIHVGKIGACSHQTLEFVLNEKEEEDIRIDALGALENCGENAQLSSLYDYLKKSPNLPSRFYARSIHSLYPKYIGPKKLLNLIKQAPSKVSKPERHFKEWIDVIIEKERDVRHLGMIIPDVLRLAKKSDFSWLDNALAKAVVNWLENSPDDPEWLYKAMKFLDSKDYSDIKWEIRDIKEQVNKSPAHVRQKYFWKKFDSLKSSNKGNGEYNKLKYDLLFDQDSIFGLLEKDYEWLIKDASSNIDEGKRILAFETVISLCRQADGSIRNLGELKNAAASSNELKIILDAVQTPHQMEPWEIQHKKLNWINKLRTELNRIKFHKDVLQNFDSIADASNVNLLCRLYNALPNKNEGTATDKIHSLSKEFSLSIQNAFINGLQAFWPSWKAKKNDRTNGDALALLAVQYEEENEFDFSSLETESIKNLILLSRKDFQFPKWFSKLLRLFPTIVKNETSKWVDEAKIWDDPQIGHSSLLSNIVQAEDDVIQLFAPAVFQKAKNTCPIPINLRTYVCYILAKSSYRSKIAEIAEKQLRNGSNDDQLFWLAVLFQINADLALSWFVNHIANLSSKDADEFVIHLSNLLYGGGGSGGSIQEGHDFKRVEILEKFIPIVCKHIRFEEDQSHAAVYTPDNRDNAESFRSNLFGILVETGGKAAYQSMLKIKDENPHLPIQDFLLSRSEQRIGIDSDIAWEQIDINNFEKEHEQNPRTANDLFKIGLKRLKEIKDKMEKGDYSSRELFDKDTHETLFQKFTAERLEELSRNRYSLARETEVDQKKEPDIRLLAPGLSPLSIEIKCAHKCSANGLAVQLQEQLVDLYLRAVNSRHGIFLLYNAEKGRTWRIASLGKLDFEKLLEFIGELAKEIESKHPGVECLRVIGIDLTNPG